MRSRHLPGRSGSRFTPDESPLPRHLGERNRRYHLHLTGIFPHDARPFPPDACLLITSFALLLNPSPTDQLAGLADLAMGQILLWETEMTVSHFPALVDWFRRSG